MPAKRALALDLGTTFGYARSGRDDGKLTYGSVKLKTKPTEHKGKRYDQFDAWLAYVLPDVSIVYYEEVRRHIGTAAAHMYGGYQALLLAKAFQVGIPVVGVNVGTIKKFATGRGNASKDEMIAAAKALGYNPQDDNAADAIHILRCGLAQENSNA